MRKLNKRRVNINITEELVEDLDMIAENMGLNRTSVMVFALKQYVDSQKALDMVKIVKNLKDENAKD